MSHVARREAIAVAAETARLEIQAEVEKARHGRSSLDSMGRLIVDTWPLRHPLGEQVAKVEYEFERL
jgi:hypothetical protein